MRYDQNRHYPLVAMPPISQQHPSDNAIKPGRRERVSYPTRHLIRRQGPVEAARTGHFCFRSPRRRGGDRCATLGAALMGTQALTAVHVKWCDGVALRALALRERIAGSALMPLVADLSAI